MDKDGNIYVTNNGNHSLFKISKELKESSCWPLMKSKASNIENSKILKIHNDKLYICDCDNSRF